jgi:hypothetical protein
MSSKNRCFGTIKALRRLRPDLLRDVLSKFPECMAECGIHLPNEPDIENMPYDAIHAACMSATLPQEMDDVLYFVCALGTNPGWDRISAQHGVKPMKAESTMRTWLSWIRSSVRQLDFKLHVKNGDDPLLARTSTAPSQNDPSGTTTPGDSAANRRSPAFLDFQCCRRIRSLRTFVPGTRKRGSAWQEVATLLAGAPTAQRSP